MKAILTRKRIGMFLAGLLALISLVMAAWMVAAGPVAVYRILRYGTTTIHDFNHYPARSLRPSDHPQPLIENLQAARLFQQPRYGDGQQTLDSLLEGSDSIAFLILKDDQLLYERYFQGHTAASYSQFFSVSKSILSALIGLAIDDGYIRSVDQPVTDFVPDLEGRGFENINVRHLLQMTSGTSYVENDNPFGIHVRLNYTPSLEKDILGFRAVDEPGAVFRYKSGDNALLALMLDRALGEKTITAYTQERLWDPLGMEYGGMWSLDHETDGLEKTWCCLAATARDLAGFGRFYLNEGRVNGSQVLSSAWVEASTHSQAVTEAGWPDDFRQIGLENYGYQWWLVSPERGDFLALGKDGQYLYVDPVSEVVIVRLGESPGGMGTSGWLRLFKQLAE